MHAADASIPVDAESGRHRMSHVAAPLVYLLMIAALVTLLVDPLLWLVR